MFGVWDSLYSGGGPLAILLGLAGVTLASLFLVLDFDFIEQGIRNGIPKPFAWTAAFGLMVTLVWLYLEILRLIAILRRQLTRRPVPEPQRRAVRAGTER